MMVYLTTSFCGQDIVASRICSQWFSTLFYFSGDTANNYITQSKFLQCPHLESPSVVDITQSRFAGTLISMEPHHQIITEHFQWYPVIYLDLKVSPVVI